MEPESAAISHEVIDAAELVARYFELLKADNSPLLSAGPAVREQLSAQFRSVIAAVGREVHGIESPVDEGLAISETIGRRRAVGRMHPSQSLRAASSIFEAGLPAVVTAARERGLPDPESAAAIALNREILERMASAAAPYVEHLLDKAHATNRDERRRLSRELHDVAAPAVAIGLQNLELFELYRDADAERAELKLAAARQALVDALTIIRNLSAQSRESVATNGLESAMQRFLDSVPTDIAVTFDVIGDVDTLSLVHAEELFLVIREAVRNAVDHGAPTRLDVSIRRGEAVLTAEVTDDGCGFDLDMLRVVEGHVGIDSMYERVDLLGAEMSISSARGSGTSVTVRVPLPDRAARSES